MGGIDLQVISDIGTTLSVERGGEGPMRSENPGAVVTRALPRLEPLRCVRTDALEVAYFEAGPSDGEVALLASSHRQRRDRSAGCARRPARHLRRL